MKLGIIHGMKFLAMLAFLPAVAHGVSVESLPPSAFADTEVATNIPFVVSFDTMNRLEFSLSLDASPTNAVEVSIGADANVDGVLSLDEADYTFGCRCGMWFWRDAVENGEVEWDAEGGQRISRTFLLKKRNMNASWNLVRIVRRGVAEIGEVVMAQGLRRGFALEVR